MAVSVNYKSWTKAEHSAIKFRGSNTTISVWRGLGLVRNKKKCFQRQLFTKYLRLTLVSYKTAQYAKSLTYVFQENYASIKKIFMLAGRLGTGLSFYEV